MMYKNLKIAINDQQPLDEVVKALKEKGYWIASKACDSNQAWCFESGRVLLVESMGSWHFSQAVETTLAELKEM